MKSLKLTIELVPKTSWYSNLRSVIPRSKWSRLRKQVYADYGYRCGICGAEGRLEAHEVWEYDDERLIQHLSGFIALCLPCHHIKHIGLTGILAQQGQLDFEEVVTHFLKVNGCTRKEFEKHKEEAFKVWKLRSLHQWAVDLGEWKSLVEQKKEV